MEPSTRRSVAALLLLVCVGLTLYAWVLALHFEDTPRAVADEARGQAVALASLPGALVSLLALVAARAQWSVVPLGLAGLLSLTGAGVAILG